MVVPAVVLHSLAMGTCLLGIRTYRVVGAGQYVVVVPTITLTVVAGRVVVWVHGQFVMVRVVASVTVYVLLPVESVSQVRYRQAALRRMMYEPCTTVVALGQ